MKDANMPLVGVVEDDASTRESLDSLLRSAGYRVESFESPRALLDRRAKEPLSCLVMDVELPGMTGIELQERLAENGIETPIIFLTGRGTIPMCVRALKAGAREFLTKPLDPEVLLGAVRLSVTRCQEPKPTDDLIGESSAFRAVLQQIQLVAESNATVLLTGESGTGKELVARAIHRRSRRRAGQLVKVNCGAIPDTLFESEFFGSVKGAFTGALRDKPGRFELADGGTLFLDEIGEVPLALQPKLLRAIQEQEIERVGDVGTRKVDVRIVAATNRDLTAEIGAGRFREDLYYRLHVFPIHLPPLRERKDDIPRLAEHFLKTAAARLGCPAPSLEGAAVDKLTAHSWPGNIRELQNVLERALLMSKGGPLTVSLAPASAGKSPPVVEQPVLLTRSELKERERESILAALARTDGKVFGPNGAAVLLGMKPTTLYSRIQALDLRGLSAQPRYEKSELGS